MLRGDDAERHFFCIYTFTKANSISPSRHNGIFPAVFIMAIVALMVFWGLHTKSDGIIYAEGLCLW